MTTIPSNESGESSRFGAWAAWVVRHRALTIGSAVVLAAALATGTLAARFSTDYRVFFAKSDPKLQALQKLEKVFTKTDNILFVLRARTGDVFARDTLAAIQALTKASWKLPFATRVDSMTNFQHSFADGEEVIVRPLAHRPAAKYTDKELKKLREVALAEPLLRASLLATDARASAINVNLRLPQKDPAEVVVALQAARKVRDDIQHEFPGVEIRISGMAAMNAAFMEASMHDMQTVFPLMALFMIAVLVLLLRSVYATFAVLTVVLLSAAATMGAAGLLGYPLTPPSAAAPTIVIALAIADGVHIVLSTMRQLALGLSRRAAVTTALRDNARPVFLTSLTTAIGFLALNFAETPPMWHLANMTAVGVTVAWALSISLLPAILSFLPLKPRTEGDSRAAKWLASMVLARRRPLLWGGLTLAFALGAFALNLKNDDRFLEYFDHSIAFRRDTEFANKHLGGIYTIEYQLSSGKPSGIVTPGYLKDLDRFADWLRKQPEVNHVYALSDIVKRLNQNLNEDKASFYRLPETRQQASQFLLLYQMSLPFGLDLNDRINVDKSSTRLTVIAKDVSSAGLRRFTQRSEDWLRQHTPQPMWTSAASPVVIFSHLSARNTRSMMNGNFLSLLLISGCLILALASLRLGLLSVIPNLMPIAMAYGLWSLFVGHINIVGSVAGALSLGVIVDDTIHILESFQRKRKAGQSARTAVYETLLKIAPAVTITSCVLVSGFLILTLSSFQMTSDLGLLSALVVAIALFADLLVLPPLLLSTAAGVSVRRRLGAKNGSTAATGQRHFFEAS